MTSLEDPEDHGLLGIIFVMVGIVLLITGISLSLVLKNTGNMISYIGPPSVVYALILGSLASIGLGMRMSLRGRMRKFIVANSSLFLLLLSLLLPWWVIYLSWGPLDGQWLLMFLGNRVVSVVIGEVHHWSYFNNPYAAYYLSLALVSLSLVIKGFALWSGRESRWMMALVSAMVLGALVAPLLVAHVGEWVFPLPMVVEWGVGYAGPGPGWFFALIGFVLVVRGLIRPQGHKEPMAGSITKSGLQ